MEGMANYRDEELEAAKHAALVEGAPMVDRHLAQFAEEESRGLGNDS